MSHLHPGWDSYLQQDGKHTISDREHMVRNVGLDSISITAFNRITIARMYKTTSTAIEPGIATLKCCKKKGKIVSYRIHATYSLKRYTNL